MSQTLRLPGQSNMKMLLAGATGALGRRLVPRLIAEGHDVVGLVRSEEGVAAVRALGATPALADALDADAVGRAVAHAAPDVVINELTALAGGVSLRHFDRTFAATNRLRSEGTDILLAAAQAAGVRRFVAQSFAGWPFARTGAWVKSEDERLDPSPHPAMRESHAALCHLERAVQGASGMEGMVLRYGGFYGPGTPLTAGGEAVATLRKRQFPIVGAGSGVWSFVHIEDAAEATAIASLRGAPGIYHVVDDEPAPVREWLPVAAASAGAKPPRRVPRWVGRLAAGPAVTLMLTESRGAANAHAKRELGWSPAHPSWRTGFVEAFAA